VEDLEASVFCASSGNIVNSPYVIAMIPLGATLAGIGFALADQPSASNYTANSCCSYNSSGGAVSVVRSAMGQYTVTFSGLNTAQVSGGTALVSGSNTECNVSSWKASGADVVVGVNCYNPVGAPLDSGYEVLVFAPVVGPASQVLPIGGTPQSTYVNTPFGSAQYLCGRGCQRKSDSQRHRNVHRAKFGAQWDVRRRGSNGHSRDQFLGYRHGPAIYRQ